MLVRLAKLSDSQAITDIYNQGIEDRSSTFETQPRTVEDMQPKVADMSRYPVLVVELDGEVVAWANLSSYRARSCYDGIADFSIYLRRDARGRGIGKVLLNALLAEAEARGFWKVLSRIFTFNEASLALCRSCGFRQVGVYEKHACLEGRWLDCAIVERVISSNQPVSGESA
ncbi:arsinothricin resistance N-acetyltransferase ArsN1 family A [Pseudomonas aeruginosa]|jgi:phosphinothricin acetyltransferase|uniref:arsinothricin resistance N-acetyltransferase ArsN1 family A n=1 Tax=Pseudomonas TaxID=286 RepID=UPI000212079C|nr:MULTISPECIES: arsinothricin resistance N-acetyltransferase ArsN1 family A [Pseudomonas]KFB21930.1 GCN5 family acetyltransferase [Pseudomonas aeruginosa PGPR2]MDG0898517.1 arsinothricin resistance N-acetyltransferase ArsN1 [Pseudomonas sp. L01]HCL2793831.1 N-acetyltransferase [Pseudomonas aeruginosa 7D9A]AFM67878.1 GCN5-like N-acetyltransferase [Pseudomonas aeruginosa DK2]AJO81398.1 GCN5 family acetyltransferase [Pseudomonas sp. MRSN 12121]